ncbi:MAG: putative lipid II flippase FtsW [Candidatus Babeliaceae bacterium]
MKQEKIVYVFVSIIAILIIIGLVFIYSSSSAFALEKCGSADYFLKKQIVGLFLGIIGLLVCMRIPCDYIERYAFLFFLCTLGLTALTFVSFFSVRIHGSSRWLHLCGFLFQPSELLKCGFIIYLASYLTKKEYTLHSFVYGYLPIIIMLACSALVLLLQPDFGQMVTLCATTCIIFVIARIKWAYLAATVLPAVPITALLIYIKPYRFKRIVTFLNPWNDPQGAGFQIIQSLIAIGSGGFWGVGIAQSKQKFFYLPMQHTDFIFSIIAEETGFFGAFSIIFLYLAFLYTGFRLAMSVKDLFACYVILGFVVLITLQAGINISVASGLLPTKGLGLPFISYGKSALIANLCMVGVIINCARSQKSDI